MISSLQMRAAMLSAVLLILLLGIWEGLNVKPESSKPLTEYEMLMGGASEEARVPPPSQVISLAVEQLGDPFYDTGPND